MARKLVFCLGAHALVCLFSPFARAALPAGFVEITLATGITNATGLAVAPDGRVFFGQQNGIVRVISNGVVLPTPFITVPAVTGGRDRGLATLAIDPGFRTNNFIYLQYTANSPAPNVVQRVSRVTANGNVAAPGSELVLFETDPFTTQTEVGGALGVGPDGMLYFGIGEGDSSANAQTTNNAFGKILRIQRDGSIPSDNPFFGSNTGKNRAVWALGFRNPFTVSFDSTGRLYVNDVGSGGSAGREEINHVQRGANYGWPTCEGACANAAFRNPVFAFPHGNGMAVITGGTFYDPSALMFGSSYRGKYFFAEHNTSQIRVLDPATTNISVFATGLPAFLVAVQIGPDGALYYSTRSASGISSGSVGKIVSGVSTLLPFQSSWRYLDTGENLGSDWVQPGYNDSAWSNGVAQLGWGANGETTLVRSNRTDGTRMATTYFRRSFVISDTKPFANYVVGLVRDDGAVVYVNGTEVFRSNMPTGAINFATLASASVGGADERAVFGAVVPHALLVPGTNVIAVEVHQNATNAATDMSFDAGFFGLNGTALRAFLAGGELVIAYPSAASQLMLESSPVVQTNAWQAVTNAPVLNGEELRVSVPISSSHRFFRLRSP